MYAAAIVICSTMVLAVTDLCISGYMFNQRLTSENDVRRRLLETLRKGANKIWNDAIQGSVWLRMVALSNLQIRFFTR